MVQKRQIDFFELSINKTHQFFSVVLNFHRWRWIDETELHSIRANELYFGIIFSLNLFYWELRFNFVPFRKIIKQKTK